MSQLLTSTILLGATFLTGTAPRQDAESRAEALRAAASIAEPGARRQAVSGLLSPAATVDEWLAAIALFERHEAAEPGPSLVRVPLWTGSPSGSGDGTLPEVDVQVYVPPGYDPAVAAPLMLQLHEAGGSAAGAHRIWKAVADELGMLVVAPGSASGEWGYGFTRAERTTALSALRWARLHYHVDPARVFVSGISRGGHMAWDLALRHPDRFAALIPMIGGPRFSTQKAQNNVRFLEHLVSMPIRDLQGADDDPALVGNLQVAFAQLKKWKAADAEYHEFPGLAHDFRFQEVDWGAFLRDRRDPGVPERTVLWAQEAGARRHGLECLAVEDEVQVDFPLSVRAARWNSMSEQDKRELVVDQSLQHSARLELLRTGVGKFTLKAERATAAALWLERAALPERGEITVKWKGRNRRYEVQEDAGLLVRDFVERLDPRFLPVARVEVP